MRVRRARRRRGRPAASGRLEKNFSADAAVGPISARFAQNCATLRGRARTRRAVDRARCDAYRIGKSLSSGIDFLFSSRSSTLHFRIAALDRRHEKPSLFRRPERATTTRCASAASLLFGERGADDRGAPVTHAASAIRRTRPAGGCGLASSTTAGRRVGWIARPADVLRWQAHWRHSLGRPSASASPVALAAEKSFRPRDVDGAPGTGTDRRGSIPTIRCARSSDCARDLTFDLPRGIDLFASSIRPGRRPRRQLAVCRRAQHRSPRTRRGGCLRGGMGFLGSRGCLVPRRAVEPAGG